MPVMKHGDVRLYETIAICRYIDTAFDGPALQPNTPVERARMAQWISVVDSYLYPAAVLNYAFHYIFPKSEDGAPDRAAIEAHVPELKHCLSVIDAGYGENEWLAGDTLTLAECFVMPLVATVSRFPEGQDILEKLPNLRRAFQAVEGRHAYQAAQPEG